MNTLSISIATPVVLATLLGPALTQSKSEGPVMAIAQGLFVDGATALPGVTPSTLLFTNSDFSDVAPPPWSPTPGLPDWSTMLGGAPPLSIDGFSIGFDYIQSTPTGYALIPPGHWAGFTFSVTRGTVGAPGSKIAAEVAAPGGAAADIFFYILPGSTLPADFVDRPMRIQNSNELSVETPALSSNITEHDLYVSLIFKENPQIVPTLPFIKAIFSVTAASVPLVPAAWWGAAPPSGATILARDWIGGAWGPVYPMFTPADLGLGVGEDVDGLAVDLIHGHVLFSTTRPSVTPGAPLRDPLLYHAIGTPGNFVYTTMAGSPAAVVPVSSRLGLGSILIDDVDGICALDPGGNVPQLNRLLGTPQPSIFPPAPGHLGAAVYRRRSPVSSAEEFVTYMTGFPSNPPAQGIAFVGISLGTPLGPYTTANSFLRPNPFSYYFRFQGHPEKFVQHIPSSSIWLGVDVYFTWAAFDGTGLDVSYPVGIKI